MPFSSRRRRITSSLIRACRRSTTWVIHRVTQLWEIEGWYALSRPRLHRCDAIGDATTHARDGAVVHGAEFATSLPTTIRREWRRHSSCQRNSPSTPRPVTTSGNRGATGLLQRRLESTVAGGLRHRTARNGCAAAKIVVISRAVWHASLASARGDRVIVCSSGTYLHPSSAWRVTLTFQPRPDREIIHPPFQLYTPWFELNGSEATNRVPLGPLNERANRCRCTDAMRGVSPHRLSIVRASTADGSASRELCAD